MPELRSAIRAWMAATKRGDAAAASEQLAIARRAMEEGAEAPAAAVDAVPPPAAPAPPPAPEAPAAPPVPAAVPDSQDDSDELMEALRLSMMQ